VLDLFVIVQHHHSYNVIHISYAISSSIEVNYELDASQQQNESVQPIVQPFSSVSTGVSNFPFAIFLPSIKFDDLSSIEVTKLSTSSFSNETSINEFSLISN